MINLGRGISTIVIGCLLILPHAGVAQTSRAAGFLHLRGECEDRTA